MNTELTPEKIMEMGRFWDETYLSQFNVKERLDDLSTEEIERYLQQRKDHLSN